MQRSLTAPSRVGLCPEDFPVHAPRTHRGTHSHLVPLSGSKKSGGCSLIYSPPPFFSGDDNYSDQPGDLLGNQSRSMRWPRSRDRLASPRRMRPGGSAPSLPLARPAFVLFEVCTGAAGPQCMRPAAWTQQRPQGLESKCPHACASGRDVWGHVLDEHACMYKGKAMGYTCVYRCQVCNRDLYTCLPTRAWAQLSLLAHLKV